jgi:SAM-dependent methyltransferase
VTPVGRGTEDPARRSHGGSAAADLARYYDLDLQDDPGDLDLYLALADRTGGPVLELAVGSGRLAVPLARAGHDVVGVDIDPAMLARADAAWRAGRRGRRGSLRLIEADMLTLRLEERFSLAVLALNTLLSLDSAERQERALCSLAAHLRPGGLAVVDVFLPDASDLALYDGRLMLEWSCDDRERGEHVIKMTSARHDAATASVTLTQLFDATPIDGGSVRRTVRTDRFRLVGASELVRMAEAAGLVVEEIGGDYQLTPFGTGAERVVLVARSL